MKIKLETADRVWAAVFCELDFAIERAIGFMNESEENAASHWKGRWNELRLFRDQLRIMQREGFYQTGTNSVEAR